MNKKIILLFACLTGSLVALAQDPISILRFSRLSPYGSARSTAMSGAFGALGGDISAIHVNPGGIGVFRSSEFNVTPYLDFDQAKSVDKDNKTTFLLGNMGFVFNFPSSYKWKGVNFGFGYVNMNNFNRNIRQYGGVNTASSIIDIWQAQANGNTRDQLVGDPNLAFDAALIDLNSNSTDSYKSAIDVTDNVEQERSISERGYQGEYAISVGTNFNDKLYLGIALGSQYITYKYFSEYRERVQSSTSFLDELRRQGIFESNGSGVNFKAGVIYRPIPALRFGLAVHTPTYYKLSAYDESGMYSFFNTAPLPNRDDKKFGNNVIYEYDYELKTPWRLIASAAVVLCKRIIVSGDYEYVDYPSADLEDTYHGEYDWIRDFFKYNTRAAHNFRVGAEYRANSLLSLRGGYAYSGSPYDKGDWNAKNDIQTLSAGLGFNFGRCYVDVAYLYKSATDTDYFYNSTFEENGTTYALSSEKIKTTLRNHELRCSFGVKF